MFFSVQQLTFQYTITSRSRSDVFHKKGILKNIAKFTGRHLRQGLFINKVAGWSLATLKIGSDTGVLF